MTFETASLHAGLIERRRPSAATPPRAALEDPLADLRVKPLAPRGPEPVHAIPSVTSLPPRRQFGRRFGLTVRVAPSLRERLRAFCEGRGRTAQSVLHDALLAYLETRRP